MAETSARLALIAATPSTVPLRSSASRSRSAVSRSAFAFSSASRASRCSSRAVTVARALTSSRSRSATPLSLIADLGLLLAEQRLACGEHLLRAPRPAPARRLPSHRCRRAPFERTLPLGEGRLLLGQLRRALGPVAIGILELAELGRDLLLARGRARLGGEELGLQVGEPLLLCRGGFGALRQLLLALLELRLLGGDLRCARVDLRRAKRQALGVGEALLEPRLDVRELVAYLPLAGDGGRKLGPDGLQLTFQLTFQLVVRLADLLDRGDDRGLERRRREPWPATGRFEASGCCSACASSSSRRRSSWRRRPVPKPCSVSWS